MHRARLIRSCSARVVIVVASKVISSQKGQLSFLRLTGMADHHEYRNALDDEGRYG